MMRNIIISVAVIVCVSGMAWGAPITGQYKSPDLGTDILNGRWSESFAGGTEGSAGNIVNAASWDGASLATEWTLSGPALSSGTLLSDDLDSLGNGQWVYRTEYAGGVISLKDQGPWWNSADAGSEYLVDIDSYRHVTTMTFANGERTDLRSTVYALGTFQAFPGYSVEFIIATAVGLGQGTLPENYPAYIGADEGQWGLVQKINMQIIPEPAAMSLLVLGGMSLLRRRPKV